MEFEWDAKKSEANRRKHGIEFLDAIIVFDDDCVQSLCRMKNPTEERYVTFGMTLTMGARGFLCASQQHHSDNFNAQSYLPRASPIRDKRI